MTILLIGICFYHQISLILSSLLITAWTLALTLTGVWSPQVLVLVLLILLPLNIKTLRQHGLSQFMMRKFRQVVPPMSDTEKEAIEAGTTWWESDLFGGRPDWNKLHQNAPPVLSTEEQAFLEGPVNEACRMASDFQITHEMADMPPELWAHLKAHRFFAMIIKKEYGGLEFSPYAQSLVLQKLAGSSNILAITVGVPDSLGPGELLQNYGTDEQKKSLSAGACGR